MIRSAGAAAVVLAALVVTVSCSNGDDDASEAESRVEATRGDPSAGCRDASPPVAAAAGGARAITVDGVERRYLLAAPRDVADDRPAPLVVLLHGFGSDAERFAELTQLPHEGAEAGTVVATPDAGDGQWGLDARGEDAIFVDALVDELTSVYCIDRERVSVAGMSLGSAFATTYACARQDRIAAIAAVTVEFLLGCEEPMPIVAFHGTSDPAVPYQDGAIGASLPGAVRGTELNMADWAALGACRPEPSVERVGSDVVRRTWPDCAPGTDVVLYTIEGGGHTWPGADPTAQVGHTTDEVDATGEALAFLAHHRRD